jgi:succinyl-diaminopimelate desuccinylase
MKVGFENVSRLIDGYSNDMTATMQGMIPIRAISPSNGGRGESDRADFLEGILKGWGFDVKRIAYSDGNSVARPNLISKFGDVGRTIWFVAHMDTVTEGDPAAWKRDPYVATVDGDSIYGRGTNDNGQALISSLYAMKALKESGLRMKFNFGLLLVSDEEEGSKFGMQPLMAENLFDRDDMFMVPDWGTESGDLIELGEKGMLWLRVRVSGKQVHASTPAEGCNAFRYMIRFLDRVDVYLHEKYGRTNPLFNPKYSTFEMTKHERSVESINIIPGSEIAYMDCRVLPEYDLDEVIADVKSLSSEKEFSEAKITVDVINRLDAAKETDRTGEAASLLHGALYDLRGVDAGFTGIGGGTCAAFPRKNGYPAVVWSTLHEVAHQPNEFASIRDMLGDAKVFAYLCL